MKSRTNPRQTDAEPSTLAIAVVSAIVVFALLHAYAAAYPGALNWGVHIGAFFDGLLRFLLPLLLALATIPKIQQTALAAVQRTADRASRLFERSPVIVTTVVCIGLAALFWFARQRLYFLGDGFLILRTLTHITDSAEVVVAYRNEPLSGWLVWNLYRLFAWLDVPSAAERAFQFINIALGVGCVLLVAWFARMTGAHRYNRWLAALFILAAGSSQLFFGYVEHYTATYFGILLYVIAAARYINGRSSLLDAAAAMGLLTAFHLGMLALLPAFLYLCVLEARRRKMLTVLLSLALFGVVAAALLLLSGYTVQTFIANLREGGGHLVPLSDPSTIWQSYTMFSLWHVVDLANLHLLVAPFALIAAILFVVTQRAKLGSAGPLWWFLSIAACGGIAFTFLANAKLGLSRDWDLFSVFLLPLILLAAYGWGKFYSEERRLWMGVILATVLHSACWVVLNATSEPALLRYQSLQDTRLWSRGAVANASEELAIFYRDRKEYDRALIFFDKFVEQDPWNARIWVSISKVHNVLGNKEKVQYSLEQAVRRKVTMVDPYIDLAAIYLDQQRYEEARHLTVTALEMRPHSAPALNNMGVVIAQTEGDWKRALQYFAEAADRDSTLADAFLNAGLCHQRLGNVEEMKRYWQRYLQLSPNAPAAGEVRKVLSEVDRRVN
jgi:Tfp pilus assembly protein PilF